MDKFIHVSLFWPFLTLYSKHKHFLCTWCTIHVYDLDLIDPLTVKVEFIIVIGSDLDIYTIDLFAFGNEFIIIFDGINLNSHKLNKFEHNYVTNNSITIIANCICESDGASIVIAFLAHVVYFVIQVIDESLLNITLLIEFDAIIAAIAHSILNLGVQSSIGPVDCNTQVMHHVCVVFLLYFFFYIVFFLPFFLSLYVLYC